jgi:hypothetical protein
MKLSKLFIPLILCQVAAFPLFASEPTAEEIRLQNQYIEYRLAQGEIYKVYVKMTDGVPPFSFLQKSVKLPERISVLTAKGPIFKLPCSRIPIISVYQR